ncbi:glycosyl hydrolase (plasmid) [Priestia megaterium]|uniref:glycosyl hydrolase n=1 Tax=Priestia megaterium TaxID=1404 RepID=UPI002ACE016C|nr:glycosyl hydrolase [Priestia megaterium]
MKKLKTYLAFLLAPMFVFSTFSPAYADTLGISSFSLANSKEEVAVNGKINEQSKITQTENLVDPLATKKTRSLFAYLKDIRGKHILFGHQHATDEGLTLTNSDKFQSEVNNSVGDFPAVFGWDTLSLEGKEKPGVPNDLKKSRENLILAMKKVDESGGIITLSSHLPNFVTGGSFNDTSGSVVQQILPGGDKNREFNAFLDNLALFAKGLKDKKGNPIPVLFRPFHEQNGSWFWWGAKTTTVDEYVEIYRYTVEYLRDKKGVHNFLYIYSPNGTFGGSQDNYLTTYPGDDYVDILGMDQYDNQDNPGTNQFLDNLVKDLAMISKLADDKDKIATFSEFGYSPQGMKTIRNGDLNWFTKLLEAIKSNPDAKRIAYMHTWANFALNGNLFVPYRNAPNNLGDHELLSDFVDYYNDPYTSFLKEVKGVYNYDIKTEKEEPFMHIVTPIKNTTITKDTTTFRVRALNYKPTKVTYKIGGSNREYPMRLDREGYYSAKWSPSASLNGKSTSISIKAYKADQKVQEQNVKVFIKVPDILMKEINFDSSIEDIKNKGAYPESIYASFKHQKLNGDGKLKIDVTGLKKDDIWQEIKMELLNKKEKIDFRYLNRVTFDVMVPKEGQNSNASLRGIAMLLPDEDTKYGLSMEEKKLGDLDTTKIKGVEYIKFPASIGIDNSEKLSNATSLGLSVVGSHLNGNFPMYIDNIKLINNYNEPQVKPESVDDFESYQGDNAALATKFVHAGGDNTVVSLDALNKSNGDYGMKLDYTLAGSGYAGITTTLGNKDWSEFNKLKFWLRPDGKNQKLVIQLRVDGVTYEVYPPLDSTTSRWVEVPFDKFTVAPWDTMNTGKVLNKEMLKKVQDFSIYINAENNMVLKSTLFFDDIKAFKE